MESEDLGLSRPEQLEIRSKAVAGYTKDVGVESELPPELAADIEASLKDAARQLSAHFKISLEEAKLILAERAAAHFTQERYKE